jgi:hypothetical protein
MVPVTTPRPINEPPITTLPMLPSLWSEKFRVPKLAPSRSPRILSMPNAPSTTLLKSPPPWVAVP